MHSEILNYTKLAFNSLKMGHVYYSCLLQHRDVCDLLSTPVRRYGTLEKRFIDAKLMTLCERNGTMTPVPMNLDECFC